MIPASDVRPSIYIDKNLHYSQPYAHYSYTEHIMHPEISNNYPLCG